MQLEIYGKIYNVVRSYYPEEGKIGFEFPVLLHGTKIAIRTAGWPTVWYVGFIKVNPFKMTLHFVGLEDLQYRKSDPEFYKELWILNKLDSFGILKELHILESPEVII